LSFLDGEKKRMMITMKGRRMLLLRKVARKKRDT
jgi:hypothetical protein